MLMSWIAANPEVSPRSADNTPVSRSASAPHLIQDRSRTVNLKSLTLGKRIAAVGCLVLFTISAALFYFIQEGFSKDIAFTQLELAGNAYQKPLEDLLQELSEHQLLARLPKPTPDQSARASILQEQIDDALKRLQTVDAQYGTSLQFTRDGLAQRKRDDAHWENVLKQWNALKSAPHDPSNSDAPHEAIITNVRTMIAHAGDTSNLALDSDLDSYYLIDATLNGLPQTEDRLTSLEKLNRGHACRRQNHRRRAHPLRRHRRSPPRSRPPTAFSATCKPRSTKITTSTESHPPCKRTFRPLWTPTPKPTRNSRPTSSPSSPTPTTRRRPIRFRPPLPTLVKPASISRASACRNSTCFSRNAFKTCLTCVCSPSSGRRSLLPSPPASPSGSFAPRQPSSAPCPLASSIRASRSAPPRP